MKKAKEATMTAKMKLRTCFELLAVFLKLGLFSFGGGPTMLTLIRAEFVLKRRWLTDDELLAMSAISESTPGPIAVNLATYLGERKAGFWGSLFATAGVVFPSFLIMFIISFFFEAFLSDVYVRYAFQGIKCGVIIVILRAGISLFKGLKKDVLALISFTLTLVLMLLFTFFAVDFSSLWFIMIGAFLGLVFYGALKGRTRKSAS